MEKLKNSMALSEIDFSTVDTIYLTVGHGTCVDFITSPDLKNAIELPYERDTVVAADGHGPIAFTNCAKPDGTSRDLPTAKKMLSNSRNWCLFCWKQSSRNRVRSTKREMTGVPRCARMVSSLLVNTHSHLTCAPSLSPSSLDMD